MSFEGTIQAIADQFVEILEAERCSIRRPINGDRLTLLTAQGAYSGTRQKNIQILGTVAGEALTKRRTIYVQDITKESRYDPAYLDLNGPKVMLAIPLIFEGNELGVVQVYRKEHFSQKQLLLAEIMANSAALTLFHIDTSKMNRQAILELIDAILECKTFEEMSLKAVEKISERLDIPSCLIYRVFKKEGQQWCKIVAGVPPGAHKIGWEGPVSNQMHIKAVVEEKKILVINDPLADDRTAHLSKIIAQKSINAIMLNPIISKKRNHDIQDIIGVLVLDACNEKQKFSAEEKSFASDAGKIIANFIDRDEMTLQEFEDSVRNPNHLMTMYAKKLIEPLTAIHEITESVCQKSSKTCTSAEKMCENANKTLPRIARLELEANKTDRSLLGIRNIRS